MDNLKIGNRLVGPDEPTFVIAEAGSNHNGDLSIAKELIEVAADAGADAVKFQTFRAEDLYVENSGTDDQLSDNESIYEAFSSLEHPREWIPTLRSHCTERDILFISTPFDKNSADILTEYVPAFKVASASVTHTPLLEHLATKDKPIIMSTGAHTPNEIKQGVQTLEQGGTSEIALLHCVASYPTSLDQINVRTIDYLRDFSLPMGLSDHTTDPVTAPVAAVARDAAIVEKHFTLDRSMEGPDHSFALEPDELDQMITQIRKTETALGSSSPGVQDVEQHAYDVARRSVHATCDIDTGEEITEDNTAILRPGNRKKGLAPDKYDFLLGARASRRICKDEGITWDDVDRTPQP